MQTNELSPRLLKKRQLRPAILLAAFVLVIAFISRLNSKNIEVRTDQKPFINLYGMQFLSDFPPEKILTLPPSCKLVGYTSVLNHQADFYTTGESSGLEVYQNPELFETLYVKRATEFARYTMTLAQCSLVFYRGNLYIGEESLSTNDIPGIVITDERKPSYKSCCVSDETLFLVQENTLPRNELETNDAAIEGSHVHTSPKSTEHLFVLESGSKSSYMRITLDRVLPLPPVLP